MQFFSSDTILCSTVASYIAEGLLAGQPAILVVTPAHRTAIEALLIERGIDCEKAKLDGNLFVLDAEETLDSFMVDGRPIGALYDHAICGTVGQILRDRPGTALRAYGEMAELLYRSGNALGAIEIEWLGNRLALQYPIQLLCGYSMRGFQKRPDEFEAVAAVHSHILDDGNFVPVAGGHPPTA